MTEQSIKGSDTLATGKRRVSGKTRPASQRAKPSKLDRLVENLNRPDGATLADLMTATGWQAHSVRGALAGTLKKKGHVITSGKIDGVRRYRIGART